MLAGSPFGAGVRGKIVRQCSLPLTSIRPGGPCHDRTVIALKGGTRTGAMYFAANGTLAGLCLTINSS